VRYLLEEKTPSEKEAGTYANGKIGGSNAENSNGFAIAKASVHFVK
jgi:hypothetical protein